MPPPSHSSRYSLSSKLNLCETAGDGVKYCFATMTQPWDPCYKEKPKQSERLIWHITLSVSWTTAFEERWAVPAAPLSYSWRDNTLQTAWRYHDYIYQINCRFKYFVGLPPDGPRKRGFQWSNPPVWRTIAKLGGVFTLIVIRIRG